jgi:hypothetical protein
VIIFGFEASGRQKFPDGLNELRQHGKHLFVLFGVQVDNLANGRFNPFQGPSFIVVLK